MTNVIYSMNRYNTVSHLKALSVEDGLPYHSYAPLRGACSGLDSCAAMRLMLRAFDYLLPMYK